MSRIGVFGGTFDPLHMGHINSMITVAGEFDLNEIRVIPAFQSPFRQPMDGPTPEQRFEMVQLGLCDYSDLLKVDRQEIDRGGVSYTVATVEALRGKNKSDDLYLIIGMDQFESFDRWKSFDKILEQTHLIVTSRPGSDLPTSLFDFPMGLSEMVVDFDGKQALLKSGNTIHFLQLDDVDVSATEIRKRFRDKQSVFDMVPPAVTEYVRQNSLYEAVSAKIGDFEKFTEFCIEFLLGRKSILVKAYDLRDQEFPAEFTIVTSGTSTKQTSALAQNLIREVKTKYGTYPQHTEGLREGRWVVLDYGATIIHIFYDYVRMEYRLEELWQNGKMMNIQHLAPKSSPS
jgi:nicotinate-nucleotide adenylyltransferase